MTKFPFCIIINQTGMKEAGTAVKGIRLLDIAKQAEVSQATVTRVIRNNGYVSQEKRERVEAALRAAGYDLSRVKDSAAQGEAPRVLLISPRSTGNLLFSRIVEELAVAFQAQGWQADLHYLLQVEAPQTLVELIERKRQGGLMGVVFCCVSMDFMPIRRYLTALATPLVMVERAPDIYGLNKVMLHSREMVFQAVHYLAHLGHKRIVYLGVENGQDVEIQRKNGFMEGVRAMDVEREAAFYPLTGYDAREGGEALRRYAESCGLPTAVVAADPVMVGVSNYLYAQGWRVPQDVSVVSIDNTYAPFSTPPLTAVDFPVAEITQNTVRILREAQPEGALPQNILISSRLIDRGSAAAPRKEEGGLG